MSRDDEISYRANGTADEYLDSGGRKQPVKANLHAFLAFFLLSVVGVAMVVSQVHGSWPLQGIGVLLTVVGLVGTTPYKWRTQYWDLAVILVSMLALIVHLKISLGD